MISVLTLVVASMALLSGLGGYVFMWLLLKKGREQQVALRGSIQLLQDVLASSLAAVAKAANQDRANWFIEQEKALAENLQVVHQHLDAVLVDMDKKIQGRVAPVLAKTDEVAKHMAMYSALIESQERLIEAVEHLALKSPLRRHE